MPGNTEYIFLQGKGSWIRPHQVNPWGKWSMVLYPDAKSLEKLRELQAEGVKNSISKDDDGWYVRLSRPTELKVNGKLIGLRPPEVFDATKPLPDGGYMPLKDTPIGNGSDVTVKMEVYQHRVPSGPDGKPKYAKAMRWNSLLVENLVPFQSRKEFTEDELKAVRGFEEQPKQLF